MRNAHKKKDKNLRFQNVIFFKNINAEKKCTASSM